MSVDIASEGMVGMYVKDVWVDRDSNLLLTEASSHTFAAVSSRVFGLRVLIFNFIFTHAAVSSRVFGLPVFACRVR